MSHGGNLSPAGDSVGNRLFCFQGGDKESPMKGIISRIESSFSRVLASGEPSVSGFIISRKTVSFEINYIDVLIRGAGNICGNNFFVFCRRGIINRKSEII